MATLTVATGNFWVDKGALVIPTSVIASEDKHGMFKTAICQFPLLERGVLSACENNHLVAGGSFTFHLVDAGREVIILGLAKGPENEASLVSALNSVRGQILRQHLAELALFAPNDMAMKRIREAVKGWPSNVSVRVYGAPNDRGGENE